MASGFQVEEHIQNLSWNLLMLTEAHWHSRYSAAHNFFFCHFLPPPLMVTLLCDSFFSPLHASVTPSVCTFMILMDKDHSLSELLVHTLIVIAPNTHLTVFWIRGMWVRLKCVVCFRISQHSHQGVGHGCSLIQDWTGEGFVSKCLPVWRLLFLTVCFSCWLLAGGHSQQ